MKYAVNMQHYTDGVKKINKLNYLHLCKNNFEINFSKSILSSLLFSPNSIIGFYKCEMKRRQFWLKSLAEMQGIKGEYEIHF